MRSKLLSSIAGALAIVLAGVPAFAQCTIDGMITAAENAVDPDLGDWRYVLEVTWDTGSPTALSHLGLVVDIPGGNCDCAEIASAIAFAYPGGSSDGEPDGCLVDYEGFVECNGDPSIPIDGILLKWEPLMMEDGCEPGPLGTGWFVFYSDYPPVPVDDSIPILAEKNDGDFCAGLIGGVFPSLPCNPVPTEGTSWSDLKALYRH